MSKRKKIVIVIFIILILCLIFFALSFSISNNKKELDLEKIKENISDLSIYEGANFYDITKENMEELLHIETEYVENVVGKAPVINIDTSMYVIIKTDKEHVSYMKGKLEEYATLLENDWKDYLESKYDLVKSRTIGVKANYVYLVISNDNSQIVNLIK